MNNPENDSRFWIREREHEQQRSQYGEPVEEQSTQEQIQHALEERYSQALANEKLCYPGNYYHEYNAHQVEEHIETAVSISHLLSLAIDEINELPEPYRNRHKAELDLIDQCWHSIAHTEQALRAYKRILIQRTNNKLYP